MARTTKPRLGIDARMYGLEHAGIGRYVMNLVDRVVKSSLDVTWVIITTPKYATTIPNLPNVEVISSSIRHYSLAEQTQFLQTLNQLYLDLLHVPHFNVPIFYNRPFMVTIHDILWHKVRGGSVTTLPPLLYYLKYLGYQYTVRHAVSAATAICVPSKYVKDDLHRTFTHLDPAKINVTYEGVTPLTESKTTSDNFLLKPYFIYVGSAYPHKNVPILLKALHHLCQTTDDHVKLMMVSSRSVFLDKIKQLVKEMGLSSRVIFAGYQSDEAVRKLLKNAVALVHPSKSEGFGLTGIEAMHAGVPVIAAMATALPEIYGTAALYFDPDNEEELATAMQSLLHDNARRTELITKGKQQAAKFSWDTMVDQTLAVYKKLL